MTGTFIRHIGIIVPDIKEAERFFLEVFGLARSGHEPNPEVKAVFLKAGDCEIQLVEDENRLRGAEFGRLDHVAFGVDDIDAVVSAAEEFGVDTAWDSPRGRPGKTRRAQFLLDNAGVGVNFQLADERSGEGTTMFELADKAKIAGPG